MFIIQYMPKYGHGGFAPPLNVCAFQGTKNELNEMLRNLNYHRNYDEIKNDNRVIGWYTWGYVADMSLELEIREEAKRTVKEFFR